MRVALISLLNLITFFLSAQAEDVMTFSDYIAMVKNHHPIAYQAELLNDMAENAAQIARGGFDPKLESSWVHKSYDDKNYYSILSNKVVVPTWFGANVKFGYDHNRGAFLNESDKIPNNGLWNAGISVPLGRGLVIDQRRADIQKARLYRNVTKQEQIVMLNKLIFAASNAYIEWQIAIEYYKIALEGVQLATTRFTANKSSFDNGDKPAIDTLESFIALQSRQLTLQKVEQMVINAKLSASNYLWVDGNIPLEMAADVIPENLNTKLLQAEIDSMIILQDQWLDAHPELFLYDYKMTDINIDIKLANEELKPDIRIEYNPLVGVGEESLFDDVYLDNYKLGATLTYPILRRKQKGKLEMNNIKLKNTKYDRQMKRQALATKLSTYVNNISQSQSQYELILSTVRNYEKLLLAEIKKFDIGESSIFLLNSRESKYLQSRYKIVETAEKVISNRMMYLYIMMKLDEILK